MPTAVQAPADPFFDNPAIAYLGEVPRWSVCDREKRPLDIRAYMDDGTVMLAHHMDERCFTDLATVRRTIPDAANSVMQIDAPTDGYIVVDIEKECPDAVRAELLSMPADYIEYSASGRGFHMVMPLPSNFYDFPVAAGKVKLQHPQRWYEILINHLCTFTHHVITPPEGLQPRTTIEEVWAELASTARPSGARFGNGPGGAVGMAHTESAPMDEDTLERIVALVLEDWANPFRQATRKSLDDFGGDNSRWEFSTLHHLFQLVCERCDTDWVREQLSADPQLCDEQLVWILYTAATRVIPARGKHQETRNGLPFLMNEATKVVASYEREDAPDAQRAPAN